MVVLEFWKWCIQNFSACVMVFREQAVPVALMYVLQSRLGLYGSE
jgi:hypothetical protein